MLKTIHPLLGPDLLWILAAMGHGDDLALVDANFPAETIAASTTSQRLVRIPGVPMDRVAEAILSVLPLDGFVDDPVRRMEVVGDAAAVPEVQREVFAALAAFGDAGAVVGIERFAFYDAAARAFAVVQVGDPRFYGCFLFRKGVIGGERP
jgi:L-fucose mutarotase